MEVALYGEDGEVPVDEIQFQGDTVTTGSPPIVVADTATVAEDSSSNIIEVLLNDTPNPSGGQGPLMVVSVTPVANGAGGAGAAAAA